jgi:hypothetical protein
MANITVPSDYNLADLSLVDSLAAPKLTEFITKFEPLILEGLFGYELYKLFASQTIVQGSGDIWDKLQYGADYRDSLGRLQKWKGLKTVLVGIITFKYLVANEKKASSGGESEAKFDNATKIGGVESQCKAWNEGIRNANVLQDYLYINNSDFPTWDWTKNEYCETINIFGI